MATNLIITGPTSTGKTQFSLDIANKFNGEIISADSRQVYIGMDIVTGKDIPLGFIKLKSDIKWHDRHLTYYTNNQTRIWLTDVVLPNEPFNVSFWKECCDLIISDIHSREKLPIIVGGTGLYIRALTEDLSNISIPNNPQLRSQLIGLNSLQLFNYLKNLDEKKAESMNNSDSQNPRRLLRAIEIAEYKNNTPPSLGLGEGWGVSYEREAKFKLLGLTAPQPFLIDRIIHRIDSRLAAGALKEAARLYLEYDPLLPSLTACGYHSFLTTDPRSNWIKSETQYLKRQFTWFGKYAQKTTWFDITNHDWRAEAEKFTNSWYNHFSVK